MPVGALIIVIRGYDYDQLTTDGLFLVSASISVRWSSLYARFIASCYYAYDTQISGSQTLG